ncbi:glycosyltransferase family 39 protein [Rhizorhapis sp. SPR117]|uniref:glycosyltransferase family 39 protein n=1 Tax=Rhizorhapis sp. SPR117 TaxID=2912611 RepID=UPI001F2F8514|nr:glycosyltransferase family 39 protein [Rhizorhapis sp. SPR117]
MFYDSSAVMSRRDIAFGDNTNLLFWVGGMAFVLASAILFLLCTRYGIGILPDSTRYMNIDDRPFDAPLYPWLLMATTATGLSVAYAAKLIGFVILCANTVLIWHILVRTTGKYAYAAVGTALIIFAPPFVSLHAMAMSEPLFIFAILVTVLVMMRFWETESQTWLFACGIAVGLATLVRFTAPPLGAAIALCIILNPRHRFVERFMDAIRLAVVSGAVFILWAFISEAVAGRSIGRELKFYGTMDATTWMASLKAYTTLLLPSQLPLAVTVGVLCLVLLGGAWLSVWHGRRVFALARETRVVEAMLPVALGLFFLSYTGFLLLSTAIEANLLLNGRYTFPVYVTSVIMMTILLAHASAARGPVRGLHWMLVGLAALILASHMVRTVDRTHDDYREGIGFVSRTWASSPTMQAVDRLPADALIYSNGVDVMGYLTKRSAHYIPYRIQWRTGLDDPRNPYLKQVESLRLKLAQENAFVVFFDDVDWRFYLASEAELKRLLNLKLINSERDGRIYAASPTVAEGTD